MKNQISNGVKNSDNQQLLLDLFRAYFDARKNKRRTVNALAFEAGYEKKLFKLHEDIIDRRYKISPSICFIVDKPVKREIFAGSFRDRIVHHLIFNYINAVFEKHFIKDSFSCRIGKGTAYGIKRANHFIRSCSENYQKDCWILKLDIKGYFMAMNRNILFEKIERKLRTLKNTGFDVDLILYLIRTVVFNDPTKNCRIKGKREDWVGLPKSKSLFFSGQGKGFPIGNLTSQLFANIYLDEFDHFVREKISIKYYGRYVDDMIFVHSDRARLKKAVPEIRNYLRKELGLSLHPRKIYFQHFEKGLRFLGVFIKPWRIYAGRRTKNGLFQKAREWNGILERKNELNKTDCADIMASANSYLGIMKNYETFRLREKILGLLDPKFWEYFFLDGNLEKLELNKEAFGK